MDPKLQAQMDADLAKPLPGAPTVKRPAPAPPAAKPLTPAEQAAVMKALRERMDLFRTVGNTVRNQDLLK
jgi:hypothetical protein